MSASNAQRTKANVETEKKDENSTRKQTKRQILFQPMPNSDQRHPHNPLHHPHRAGGCAQCLNIWPTAQFHSAVNASVSWLICSVEGLCPAHIAGSEAW
jgi:hypothetical protein